MYDAQKYLKTIFLLIALVISSSALGQAQGKFDVLTLKSTTIPSTCTGGQLRKSTSDGKIKICTGTIFDEATLNTTTQTLSNKTLTSPTINTPTMTSATLDVMVWDDQTTPSNPSAGFYKTYFKNDGFLYKLNSSGTEAVVGSSTDPTVQKFTSGSGTYTTPAGVNYIIVTVIGSGGGGTGSTGTGGNGNASTFGSSLLTGSGGAGAGGGGSIGGTGGSVTVNSPAVDLGSIAGEDGGSADNIVGVAGANGGNSCLGGAGRGGASTGTTAGAAAKSNSGSGGGGAGATGGGAGNPGGGAGGCVRALITSPSATYAYAVGAAGAAGTGSPAGGAGAAGIIIVEEYY